MPESVSVVNSLISNGSSLLMGVAAVLVALTSLVGMLRSGRIEKKVEKVASTVNGQMEEMKGELVRRATAEAKLDAVKEQKVETLIAKAHNTKDAQAEHPPTRRADDKT